MIKNLADIPIIINNYSQLSIADLIPNFSIFSAFFLHLYITSLLATYIVCNITISQIQYF